MSKKLNFWIFAAVALVGVCSAIGAMLLGLAAFAAGSDAGTVAALGFEMAAITVLVCAAVEMERAS